MLIFVSYSRRDNTPRSLRAIAERLARLGRPYVDDFQDNEICDRQNEVEQALYAAELFVAVRTPNYLRTAWTRWEFDVALERHLPILTCGLEG